MALCCTARKPLSANLNRGHFIWLWNIGIADKGGFPRSDLSVILVHCQDLVQHLHQSMTFLHGCTIVPVHIYIYMELLIRKCCYFALCEPMVWQNLIGKDLFEGFVKGCGKKKKTYFVLGANLNLVMSLNFCFERELCICVRIIWEVLRFGHFECVITPSFVFSIFVSENMFYHHLVNVS